MSEEVEAALRAVLADMPPIPAADRQAAVQALLTEGRRAHLRACRAHRERLADWQAELEGQLAQAATRVRRLRGQVTPTELVELRAALAARRPPAPVFIPLVPYERLETLVRATMLQARAAVEAEKAMEAYLTARSSSVFSSARAGASARGVSLGTAGLEQEERRVAEPLVPRRL